MKQKINLSLAVIALVAILATALSIEYVSYKNFGHQVQKDLKVAAELLKETEVFQDAYSEADRSRVNSDIRNIGRLKSGDLRITWVAADGVVLYDSETAADALPNHMDRPEISEALETGEGQSERQSDTMRENTFYYALLLEDGTVLRVSTKADSMSTIFASALPMIGAISAMILIGCIILGQILTASLIKPINHQTPGPLPRARALRAENPLPARPHSVRRKSAPGLHCECFTRAEDAPHSHLRLYRAH